MLIRDMIDITGFGLLTHVCGPSNAMLLLSPQRSALV